MKSEYAANRALDRTLTERRQCTRAQIDYYEHQARLAERGDTQRRSAEFYRRQVAYFRTHPQRD